MASETLFSILHYPAVALYSLSILFFAANLSRNGDMTQKRRRVKNFLSWGPVLGLSMGALIAGGLGLHYLAMDGFHWSTQGSDNQRVVLKHGIFLLLWISHFHLEIWTQEPLRKLETESSETPSPEWARAHRNVRHQLLLNSGLLLGLGALSF